MDEGTAKALAALVVAGLDEDGDPLAALRGIGVLLRSTVPGYVDDILFGDETIPVATVEIDAKPGV